MQRKWRAIATVAVVSLMAGVPAAEAGVMRGDCSLFQTDSIEETGAQDFADCDLDLDRDRILVKLNRSKEEFTIPITQIQAVEVASYDTPNQGRERTVFALTYANESPDGFEILSFRVKRKRAVTVMAVLRAITDVKIHGGVN